MTFGVHETDTILQVIYYLLHSGIYDVKTLKIKLIFFNIFQDSSSSLYNKTVPCYWVNKISSIVLKFIDFHNVFPSNFISPPTG